MQNGLEDDDMGDMNDADELVTEGRSLIDQYSTDMQLFRASIE